ncbi:nebulin isoform X20 [Morone saxatilis]|uniref:nebulin isoform X20 n=1 Tax=Morone saxatilis TaxID=34816 RepID=UPI0015E21C09|nr:nebulin isoform X20 [Morone saxatilis]
MTEIVEEYEEFEEEEEEEIIEEITTTSVGEQKTQVFQSGLPTRKVRKKVKVDTSKFMTPYLAHSQKMLEQFSHNKYRQAYDISRANPPAIVTDTPEMIRIRKAQEQLSEVKYRMEGNKVRTTSLYDGEAKDVLHVKRVSELMSKVLYRQKWDETKDRYLLPPDAPELVLAVKNAANYSKKRYTEVWDEEKTMYYPYSDSPELRRVAKAQEVLSDVHYKKGHDERKAKYTSLADPPEVELARRVAHQRSDLKYKEDYNKNVKGQWCETPYFDVAIARMAMDNFSNRKYTQHYEDMKDQIYFMQTDTPVYDANKKARIAASEIHYKKEYEKRKAQSDYNTLPATENPLLRQLRYAGTILSDKVYKASYEKSRGSSINYCDTPKFQMDSVLKQFTDVHYKDKYDNEVKGHYIGSYEDLFMLHCQKVEEMKSEQQYKAEYEDIKTRCFFPQTITPEYEAGKKLNQCNDNVYRQHPGTVKFTQVVDSPVQVQAAINAKQLSDLNYHAKYEETKFKSSLPPDYPFFIQSRVNAFNLSDNCYKYDWEKNKAKKFEVKGDAISILAARAHTNIASDVKYKKEYEKNKGQMVGALSINDDPKILHSVHVAKIQSDREYKKHYEKIKTKYHTPLDMMSVTLAKKSQGIASMAGYRSISTNFFLPPDSVLLDLAKKANIIQSDNEYKSDYNTYTKGSPWITFGSMDVEKNKKAGEILSEKKYRQHPDTIPFTSIDDHPIMMQAKVNQLQRSDLFYKRGLEEIHQKYSLPPDVPEFLQAKCNAYNISNNYYKLGWQEIIAKGYDLKPDAIPVIAAKAARHAASDVQYKKAYEKARGHHVGFRSLQDDPLLVHYMEVAKLQSDKNYKKDYHKAKLKYHTPVDMMSLAHAKHASSVQTFAGYKQHHHNYCLLPDSMSLDLARTMNYNSSNYNYKLDYETSVKGLGWVPIGSLEVEKAKTAGAALNEKKYRQHPETIKFTSTTDSMSMELAKANAKILNAKEYKASGEKFMHTYHLPADAPELMQARYNAVNISQNYYTYAHRQDLLKGHHVKEDAIPIVAAKSSRDIASNYKYKLAYEKARGHHVGFRSLQDDPLLVHYMEVARLQSDKNYKKDYNKAKLKYHSPVDMLSLVHAKQASTVQTMAGYKQINPRYTVLPDAMNLELARNMQFIASDNQYKSEYQSFIRGTGWVPIGSFDVEKAKTAGQIFSESKYRQHPSNFKFTKDMQSMDLALATANNQIMDKQAYSKAWEKDKTSIHIMPDAMDIVLARGNKRNVSEKLYKLDNELSKKKGHHLRADAIAVQAAKASTTIASDYKYKTGYRKQVGHHIGARCVEDDPLLMLALNSAKIASDALYKKDFNKSKTKFNLPVDMLQFELAKKCQRQVNDDNYRTRLHQWTCLPDQSDVIQARKAYDLQSNNVYKADLEWIRGCGWMAADSVDHVKVKKAQEILNERLYKKNAKECFGKFTLIVDRPEIVLAKINAANLSDLKYKETFNAEKGQYIGSEDTPQLAHSREVSKIISEKLYKLDWDESKATGYQLDQQYIPLLSGKKGREIASDAKYKDAHEKAKGHYMAGTLVDFPEVMRCGQQEKNKGQRLYQKDYHQTKTKTHLPPDIIANKVAKRCQDMLSDVLYRTYLHQWTCHPDQEDAIRARKTNEILSDVFYKDDLNWMKGIGCYVWDTPEIIRAKKSYELQSELKYRDEAKKEFNNYSIVTDTPVYVTAVLGHTWASDLNYREAYHKEKHLYTTVLDTYDYARCHNFKHFFSNKNYTDAWDKVKAKSYQIPHDSHALQHAKIQKVILSGVKYKEDYEKFKSLYSLPKSLEDDPATARCVKAGKLVLDRLYKENYEKTKAKNHIPPDMLEILSARNTQKTVSGIHYRKYLHQWICLPDMQVYVQARKVNEQLSDIFYKDDLNWLKGIGCYAWDTPEILRVKHADNLQSENKYRAKGIEAFKEYSVVTDTPVYETAKQNAQNLSDLHYRYDYNASIKGTNTSPAVTIDTERARLANYIQSDNWYKEANKSFMPTGYSLPHDTPLIKQAKMNSVVTSNVKYKEAYEMTKARAYTLHPEGVNFVNTRKANKISNDRLYRQDYHKQKDKIHTTYDTPDIKQVKMNQEHLSDLCYREKYYNSRGQLISMPITPQLMHCYHVNEITSELKYKEDLMWLRGMGCFLYDTPEMVHVRNITKQRVTYPVEAKKNLANFSVVLDTPEYKRVTELKTHMSNLIYKAQGKEEMAKVTTTLDAVDIQRAKWAQLLTNKYKYTDLASRERAHFTPDPETPNMEHARKMKVVYSENKYKEQYEKMKHRYTAIADTPLLIRAKKSYLQSSDLRYKETFELSKGHYHTVKDALDITYHRRVTDDISEVKYREKYINSLGTWKSIPDRPEFFFSRIVNDNVSSVKYKEDLDWLKGIGCYVWDTPELVQAERNKKLYSERLYKASFEKNRGNFKYSSDTPFFQAAKNASVLINDALYKSKAKDLLKSGCNELLRPDILTALYQSTMGSKWRYREQYERAKDKFTSVLETPEYEAHKRSKKISDIIYRMEYNKTKAKGYTLPYDTPHQQHMKKVKDITSNLKYREVYEKSKAQINMDPEAHEIRAAKEAYKNITNLDYKKKYEATKNKWIWTADRPDFINAARNSLQQSDVEYKYDKEMMKGCVIPVVDDKLTLLAMKNAEMASDVKYKEKYEKAKGHYMPVQDTPQILHAKAVRTLASESKYKEASKKDMQSGSFTTLRETRDTVHSKEINKLVSGKLYKAKFEKDKGKSEYNNMSVPPDVQHAMAVAKNQSSVSYKKDAKANLHYTSVVDRPDIKKATQAAKLISEIGYRDKAREEASRGGSLAHRPDIALATEVSKLTSQVEAKPSLHGAASYDTPQMRHIKKMSAVTSDVKYKEKFDKEMKGKRPQYDMKESKIYKTLKDASELASEVKYKGDLKKIHKPVTDMAESLSMQHNLSTSKLSSQYCYKKKFEESKGHYHMIPDTPEQLHLKEASELQSNVKYKEKYEKEKGKAMLDFETPTYVTAKEAQHMQSQREYRRDLEEGVKGKGLTLLEETPELLRARNATQILCEREYKKSLEQEIKGKGMLALATDTPDFMRARNATDILSQTKYKQTAEMDRASYTSVIDTPDIIHAQQMRNIVSQKKYREEAEKTMSHYVPVLDTPEMQRVRENQKNFSTLQYQIDLKNIKGKVSTIKDTPEMLRVKENTKNFSSIQYKEDLGAGTALPETPEMERAKRNQQNISTLQYKSGVGQGTSVSETPEMERVKRNQHNISTIKYKDSLGRATAISDLPEVKRVKQTQKHISSVLYKDSSAKGTPVVFTPEMERVKRNQENISSVLYSDSFRKQVQGKAAFVLDTPEMRRVRETQRIISGVRYHEDFEKSKGSFTPTTSDPVTERVKKNTQDFSDINYRGIQRRVVEMERRRAIEHDQETITDLRVWRTNPGSVFDYDPAEDNIQSRSLHMMSVQAQRRSKEHSRSTSALSGMADEKSEVSQDADHHMSSYSNGFMTSSMGYQHAKTVELQQRSSSVATQQTTVSSIPSHPSTTGKTVRAMYDYAAADNDEVSFKDGDVIVNVQSIDEGWMYGTVQRTGKTGMLPANYVEAV